MAHRHSAMCIKQSKTLQRIFPRLRRLAPSPWLYLCL